jgi:AAA+ ATPase superfamily predicted ATPase
MNPFRFDRLPTNESFFDRTVEVQRISKAICEGENLLVYGLRRMGKTSCLIRAARVAAAEHDAVCFFADLSLYSSLVDVTEALLKSALPELGSLGDRAAQFIASKVTGLVINPHVKAKLDGTVSGGSEMELEFGTEFRNQDPKAHSKALTEALDALENLAKKRKRKVAIIFDEFTFIEAIGPERVSWQLRSVMQRHQNIVYILAGSVRHMIDRLHGEHGPFYGMFGRLVIERIDPVLMAQWIDESCQKQGISTTLVGQACIRLAGSRTRDIVQLARRTFDLAQERKTANEMTVGDAHKALMEDFDEEFWRLWSPLSALNKSILQAIAAGHGSNLFHGETIKRFNLGTTAHVSQACRTMERNREGTSGYRPPILGRIERDNHLEIVFDSPFFHAWVSGVTQPRRGAGFSERFGALNRGEALPNGTV